MWRHSFPKPGVYSLSCQIRADDDLSPDNRATVVIEVIEEVPVLVVEGAAGQSELQQDSFFLQAAMGWVNGEAMDASVLTIGTDPRSTRLDSSNRVGNAPCFVFRTSFFKSQISNKAIAARWARG